MHGITKQKERSDLKIKEYEQGLESGHYSEKYKEGYEETIKGYIAEEKNDVKGFQKLNDDLISRFVRAKIIN
ncbi:hypothetical protein RJD24_18825 [Bacillaceae bacterium IKA-2]|nr:hypothetical protein RJD24_18825 [Bacillaceae bacterium IKA-2]